MGRPPLLKPPAADAAAFLRPQPPLLFIPEQLAAHCRPAAAYHRTTTQRTSTPTRWRRLQSPPAQPPPLRRPRHPPTPPQRQPQSDAADEQACGDNSTHDAADAPSASPSDVLRLMDALRFAVDDELYVSLIKECAASRDAAGGADVHEHILKARGGPPGLLLANRLLLMYATCGQPKTARLLFDEMPERDALSWTTMVAAYSDCGLHSHREAMQLFLEMQEQHRTAGCLPLAAVATLRSCTRMQELQLGRQLHALLVKYMGAGRVVPAVVGSSLGQFYRTLKPCGDAISVFREMVRSGRRRDSFFFSGIAATCAGVGDGGRAGRQVHANAIKTGLDSDRFVASGLIHMYSEHGRLADAASAFRAVGGTVDAACWNAMLAACTRRAEAGGGHGGVA